MKTVEYGLPELNFEFNLNNFVEYTKSISKLEVAKLISKLVECESNDLSIKKLLNRKRANSTDLKK